MKIGDFMKDTRGFTLVEIMGVIAILAVVVLVTAPTLIKSLKTTENAQYDAFKDDLYLAAESYIESNKDLYKEQLLTIGGKVNVFMKTLKDENLIKHKLKNPKTNEILKDGSYIQIIVQGDGTYKYNFIDAAGSAASYVESSANAKELIDDNSNSGLDHTKPYTSRKYYIGKNPNNYLIFSGNCFSIIHITQNNSLKLIYEGTANGTTCVRNDSNSNDLSPVLWGSTSGLWDQSNIKDMMSGFAGSGSISVGRGSITIVQSKDLHLIEPATFYIGATYHLGNAYGQTLKNHIENERTNSVSEFVGLINTSDYLKISCGSGISCSCITSPSSTCQNDNYLSKSYPYWPINAGTGVNTMHVIKSGLKTQSISDSAYIRPVIYLSQAAKIVRGNGSSTSPYIVS